MLSINTFIWRHIRIYCTSNQHWYEGTRKKGIVTVQFLSYLAQYLSFSFFFCFSLRMHSFLLFDSFILWFYTIPSTIIVIVNRYFDSGKKCFNSKTDSKSAFVFGMVPPIGHWAWSLSYDHCSLSTSRNLYYSFCIRKPGGWMVVEQFTRISTICTMHNPMYNIVIEIISDLLVASYGNWQNTLKKEPYRRHPCHFKFSNQYQFDLVAFCYYYYSNSSFSSANTTFNVQPPTFAINAFLLALD